VSRLSLSVMLNLEGAWAGPGQTGTQQTHFYVVEIKIIISEKHNS